MRKKLLTKLVATLAVLGMNLATAYSLWLYNRMVSKKIKPNFLYKFSVRQRDALWGAL
jgi:NADH:ubiquinone oxidoreductase subunit 4 (subunit M)